MKKVLVVLLSLLLLVSTGASAVTATEEPSEFRPTIKILSIGHSFSVDAMKTYMWDLFDAAGYEATIAYLYYPGASLERQYHYIKDNSPSYPIYAKNSDGYWVTKHNVNATAALYDEDWDVVTFQPSPDYGQGTMTYSCSWGCNKGVNDYDHFDTLVNLVRTYLRSGDNPYGPNEDVEFYYHLTWAFASDCKLWSFMYSNFDQVTMYNDFINATKKYVLPNSLIKGVIPCITSVQNARATWMDDTFNEPGNYDPNADGYHLNDKGDLVAAMTWVAYFTGKSATEFAIDTKYSAWEYAAIAAAVDDAIGSPWSVTEPAWSTPHDHVAQETVTALPTCGVPGQVQYTCAACGLTYAEGIPATGDHVYDGNRDAECNVCGTLRDLPTLPGDVNGDGKINNKDLGLLQRLLNDWDVEVVLSAADVNADGIVSNRDLGLLMQYVNGWDTSLG